MESSTSAGKNRVSADGARSTAISSKSDRVTEVIPALRRLVDRLHGVGHSERRTTFKDVPFGQGKVWSVLQEFFVFSCEGRGRAGGEVLSSPTP